MEITQAHELKETQTIKALIYGQMGIGKTTLALSAPNPLLIDIERGLSRVSPQHRCPSLQVNSYEEILELVNSKEIMEYDTIVIDTLGKMIYLVLNYMAKDDPKLKKKDGNPTRDGWTAIKNNIMKNFYGRLESLEKNIIFIAHEKEKVENEITIKRPDVAGSTDASITTECNLVGYMEMQGKSRTIDFSATEYYYAKNSLGFENKLVLPNVNTQGNTFIQDKILATMSDNIEKQAKEREVYDEFLAEIRKEISKINGAVDLTSCFQILTTLNHIWDSKHVLWKDLTIKAKELGFEFNKENKVFE